MTPAEIGPFEIKAGNINKAAEGKKIEKFAPAGKKSKLIL